MFEGRREKTFWKRLKPNIPGTRFILFLFCFIFKLKDGKFGIKYFLKEWYNCTMKANKWDPKNAFSHLVAEFEIPDGSKLWRCHCSSLDGDTMMEASISRRSDFSAWDRSTTHPSVEDDATLPRATGGYLRPPRTYSQSISSTPGPVLILTSWFILPLVLICYELNICVSSQIPIWNPVFNGFSAFIKGTKRDLPCPFHQVRTQKEGCVFLIFNFKEGFCQWIRKRTLTRHWICQLVSWSLDFQPPKLWEISFCCL